MCTWVLVFDKTGTGGAKIACSTQKLLSQTPLIVTIAESTVTAAACEHSGENDPEISHLTKYSLPKIVVNVPWKTEG